MASDLRSILALEVPILVLLGERQMRMSDVMALVPGAIIELPKSSEEELELLANNKPVGTGVAVKVGENFGLRITYIGDIQERVRALGAAGAGGGGGGGAGGGGGGGGGDLSAEALAEQMLAGQ